MRKSVKDNIPEVEETHTSFSHSLSHEADTTLEHALVVMQELTHWLVKSGIGHTEFSAVLKPLFYNEAINELECLTQKKTDSSISLLAGLNRRDVSALRHQNNDSHQFIQNFAEFPAVVSVPARVVGMWVHRGLPQSIPVSGSELSFENLVRQVSTEKHPRSILLELKRIGVVQEQYDQVVLQTRSFTPSLEADELKKVFVSNVSDHLAAGIHNIVAKDNRFLEQAIFADELTPKSVQHLKHTSTKLWHEMSKHILAEAIECCKQDEGREDAVLKFRLGIFQYDTSD